MFKKNQNRYSRFGAIYIVTFVVLVVEKRVLLYTRVNKTMPLLSFVLIHEPYHPFLA